VAHHNHTHTHTPASSRSHQPPPAASQPVQPSRQQQPAPAVVGPRNLARLLASPAVAGGEGSRLILDLCFFSPRRPLPRSSCCWLAAGCGACWLVPGACHKRYLAVKRRQFETDFTQMKGLLLVSVRYPVVFKKMKR
jgi:hypothetical protein